MATRWPSSAAVPETDPVASPALTAEITARQAAVAAEAAARVAADSALTTALAGKATPADITSAINALVAGAPGALDTLNEIAEQLGDDEDAVAALTTLIATVQSDLAAHAAATPAHSAAQISVAGYEPDITDQQGFDEALLAGLVDAQTATSGVSSDLSGHTSQTTETDDVHGSRTFLEARLAELIGAAPANLDTLQELGEQLATDESAVAALTTTVAGKQPLDADLTAIAAVSTTAYGRALLALADAAAGRTAFGLGTSSTLNVPASGNAAAGEVVKGSDTRLSDARTPTFPITYTGAAGDDVLTAKVTGDTQQRVIINANGTIEFGSGSAAPDITLQRISATKLAMPDPGSGAGGGWTVGTGTYFGRAPSGNLGISLSDTSIERRGTGVVRSGDGTSTGYVELGNGFFQFIKQSADPANAAANGGRLYLKDNGSGKMGLYFRGPSGAAVLVAVEP